jgi:general secretion pathway protein H
LAASVVSIDSSSGAVVERATAALPPTVRIAPARLGEANARTPRGFSLIELLVVVVIVGVLALAVTLSIRGGADRQLRQEAERFAALVDQACTQAELSGREIGVVVDAGGYSFQMLAGTHWQDVPGAGELRPRRWIDGLGADLAREGHRVDLAGVTDRSPQIVCFSSGELTPFALTLALGEAPRYRVSGAEDATLETERTGAAP